MDQGEAFHRAICERPEDDLPRLVYADFLDETGDPVAAAWAEFIRVQVEIANRDELVWANKLIHQVEWDAMRPDERAWMRFELSHPADRVGVLYYRTTDPAVAALRKREDRLFDTVRNIAIRTSAGRKVFQFPRLPWWSRGFPDRLDASVSEWMTYGPELVTQVPLSILWLGNLRPDPEPDRGSPDRWGWHCTERTRFNSLGTPGRIRRDWFDLLPPDLYSFPDPSLGRWYASADEANRAVGFAALNWARKAAGLPLLAWAATLV